MTKDHHSDPSFPELSALGRSEKMVNTKGYIL